MKQIIYIDASSLKDCGGCYRKYWLNNHLGLTPSTDKEYKMAYGTAFHLFAENFYKRVPVRTCIELAVSYYTKHLEDVVFPEDEYKTPTHLIKVCERYAEEYENDCITPLIGANGEALTEAKFALPWFHTNTYEFILCGTIDLVCKYDGILCLVDHKTTSTFIGNAEHFLRSFELDIQVTLYSYIYKLLHGLDKAPEFLINGVFLKKQTLKGSKEGVFDGVGFKRSSSLIHTTNERLEEFTQWLDRWKSNLTTILESMEIYDTPNYSYCKTSYGVCKYFEICSAPIDSRDILIECKYTRKEYNPLHFRD